NEEEVREVVMRHFNKDKCHLEGYSWLRFQESKPLSALSIALLLSLAIPPTLNMAMHSLTYIAHAILTALVIRYSLTEMFISAEDDGIYLEINRKKHIKIKS